MAHHEVERITTRGTYPLYPRTATVGVSIACQTSDTHPILVESNNPTPKVTVCGSTRRKRRPTDLGRVNPRDVDGRLNGLLCNLLMKMPN